MANRFRYSAMEMEGNDARIVDGELEAESEDQARAELAKRGLYASSFELLPDHAFGQGGIPVFWFSGVAVTGRPCYGLVEAADAGEFSRLLKELHVYGEAPRPATEEELRRADSLVQIRQGGICLPKDDPTGLSLLASRILWHPCEMQGSHGWIKGELSLDVQEDDGALIFSKWHETEDRLVDCWHGEVKGASIRAEGIFRRRVHYHKGTNEVYFRGGANRIMMVLEFEQMRLAGEIELDLSDKSEE
ncbi:MAG: hypothetical protein RBU25_08685 [Lentisphaeria bacterium]|jgi:hypothetical protein|nr:hypothetical protein [Lentisphaeria bacterium]